MCERLPVRCRLCTKRCARLLTLYNEDESVNNKLYDTMIKYLDAEFLTLLNDDLYRAICLTCWGHISAFDNYQKIISSTQKQLLRTVTPKTPAPASETNVRKEVDESVVISSDEETSEAADTTSSANKNKSRNETQLDFDEYDDPVGTFTGGQFDSETENPDDTETPATSKANESTGPIDDKTPIAVLDEKIAKWKSKLNCPLCDKTVSKFAHLFSHFVMKHSREKCYIECCGNKYYERSDLAQHIDIHMPTEKVAKTPRKSSNQQAVEDKDKAQSGDDISGQPKEVEPAETSQNVNIERESPSTADTLNISSQSSQEIQESSASKSLEPSKDTSTRQSLTSKPNTPAAKRIRGDVESTHASAPETRRSLRRKTNSPPKRIRLEEDSESEYDKSCYSEDDDETTTMESSVTEEKDSPQTSKESRQTPHKNLLNKSTRVYSKTPTSFAAMDSDIAKWKKELECSLCKQTFPNFGYLNGHFKIHHPSEQCHVKCCGRRFTSRDALLGHICIHRNSIELASQVAGVQQPQQHNALLPPSTSQDDGRQRRTRATHADLDCDISKWKRQLECDLCRALVANFYDLQVHFREQHAGVECYVMCCQRKFPNRNLLIQHILPHLDADTFRCELCGKRCMSTHSLKCHKLRRHR